MNPPIKALPKRGSKSCEDAVAGHVMTDEYGGEVITWQGSAKQNELCVVKALRISPLQFWLGE